MSKTLTYFFTLMLVLIVLGPLMMMVTVSLNPSEASINVNMGTIRAFIPHVVSFENYQAVLTDRNHPFLRYLFNTTVIVGGILIGAILVNSMAAFALAWGEGRYRKWALIVVIALIAVPMESLVLPLLLMSSRAGIVNSFEVQILPFIANAFALFLFYQFFSKLPKDLIEAAKVDGLNLLQTYWYIGLPLCKPIIATLSILIFLEQWNNYLWPVMVTRGPEYRPLSVAMAAYFDSNRMFWGQIMAFAVMMTIPIMIFFLIVQRYFVQSVTGSAVKG